MEIFDCHCDTASEMLDKNQALFENSLHIDLKRLEKYDSFTQVFAVFIAPEYADCAMDRAEKIVMNFKKEAQNNSITICTCRDDFENAKTRVKAFLSLEGGEPIQSVSDLVRLHEMGIKMIAPTWNFANQLASGVESEDTGLTDFGREIIAKMGQLGIIPDVSHLSERAFWDVAAIAKGPVCASHSNLKSVVAHKRNLTDEQFLAIKKSGGVCGINLYPPFFGEDIACLKAHIDAFLALGGEDNIGLGCDFDGVDRLPRGISGVESMEAVIKNLPYSAELKEKLAFRNFLRIFSA